MSLIEELKRRKVFRVAASYAVVAFIIFQLVEILFPIFNFPQWTQQFVVIIILLGFPIALIFSWVFDKTPEGFIKTDAVKNKEKKNTENTTASKPFYLDSKNLFLLLGLVIAFLLGSYGSASLQSSVDDKSIAVLPFDNYSTAPEDQFFSDGITEVIIANLAKVKDLKVISRTSVMEYKNTTKKIKDIAKELGVAHILEGSIQRANGRVRVVGQLIDTKTDEHIWAETYDKDETDIFELQSEVAIEIAEAMKSELTLDEKARINEKLTESTIAYEYYLKGRMLENAGHTKENLLLAISDFEKSVAIDPNFAEAHAQLCKMYAHLKWYRYDLSKERMILSKNSLDKAISLKPNNAEVRMAGGIYYYHGYRDYGKALSEFTIAKDLSPSNSFIYFYISTIYRRIGDFQKSIEQNEKALEMDPNSIVMINNLIGSYNQVRNYSKAKPLFEKALIINPSESSTINFYIESLWNQDKLYEAKKLIEKYPNSIETIYNKTIIALLMRDYETLSKILSINSDESISSILEYYPKDYIRGMISLFKNEKIKASEYFNLSVDYLERKASDYPDDPRFQSALGLAHARLGNRELAIEAGRRATEILPISRDAYFAMTYEKILARIYALVGDYDLALNKIEFLSKKDAGLGYGELKNESSFDNLRNNEVFNKILENLKFGI